MTNITGTCFSLVLALGPAEGEAEGEASASGKAEGKIRIGTSGTSRSGSGERSDKKWIDRWAPENNMAELGIYLGVLFPSRKHELFKTNDMLADNGFKRFKTAAFDFGARAGFYPLRFFGVEVEGGAMPTRTRDDARATLWRFGGHAVGQVGLWSITPFVLAGAGAFSVASGANAVGDDVDASVYFGAGVKFYINRWIMLRFDVRDNLSAERGVADGVTQSFELLAGLSVTLGRKRTEPPKDTDGDGVPDWRDRCDEVPGPKPSGCPPDRDRDGFPDVEDKCPDEKGVAPDGCPNDRDKDGILNIDDACPDEPETKNRYDDDDGCPDEVPEKVRDLAGVIKGIHFDTDKDTIKRDSKPTLENVVEQLKVNPKVTVEIVGHTDSTGGRAHNLDLSRRRAESVKRFLLEAGIEDERMTTRGAGPDEPIDDNNTKDGRARNRRIEFVVKSGGRKLKVEESTLVPEKATPDKKKATPDEDKAAPDEEKAGADEEKAASGEEKAAPDEEKAAPDEEKAAPDEEKAAPDEEKAAPDEKER